MRAKKEVLLVAAGFAGAVVVCGVALWWHNHQADKKPVKNVSQTVGNHTISLDQSPASAGGLQVKGQADSLGQLGGKGSGQYQGTNSGSGSSSGGSLDPASFAEYGKYQSSQNALFGEIQQGTGAALNVGQKANIYYKVWLTNGALIDHSPVSASGQPQPFSFTLGAHQVIPGLEQGIAGMKAGGKRLIIVPPTVGYGSQGQGNIPPNAVLVFEVQLISAQ